MREERIKKLNKELEYLVEDERKKEIEKYSVALDSKDCNIKNIAKQIYSNRGINYDKLNKGFFNKLVNSLDDFANLFKSKDSKVRKKMIVDIIYMVILLVLMKLPFDLIRDIIFDYLINITTKEIYFTLINLGMLIIYTLVLICAFAILVKNFNNKYHNIEN